jgi:acetylglutamate synthase
MVTVLDTKGDQFYFRNFDPDDDDCPSESLVNTRVLWVARIVHAIDSSERRTFIFHEGA